MGLSEEKEEVIDSEEEEEEEGKEEGDKPIGSCQFCLDPKEKLRVFYPCGTKLSKYFGKTESNPDPGWYKGTVTSHSFEGENCIWTKIHFEDGDMEVTPQDELLEQQIRILDTGTPISSSRKRKRDEKDGGQIECAPNLVETVFSLCTLDKWKDVLQHLKERPELGKAISSHSSTILFQAIGSTDRESCEDRTQVILYILEHTPDAAQVKNSHGSLPLHAMCSRNVRFDSASKDILRRALAQAYPAGLLVQSGKGKTPLHIVLGDHPGRSMRLFLQFGEQAVFLKDSLGRLPIHEYARFKPALGPMDLLLKLNPDSIEEKDGTGQSVLDLAAKSTQKAGKAVQQLLQNAMLAHRQQQR